MGFVICNYMQAYKYCSEERRKDKTNFVPVRQAIRGGFCQRLETTTMTMWIKGMGDASGHECVGPCQLVRDMYVRQRQIVSAITD